MNNQLAVSFDSAFQQAQSNVLSETPATTNTTTSSGTQQTAPVETSPASTLVFAGISYWTLLSGLLIAAVVLLAVKFYLKKKFYSKQ